MKDFYITSACTIKRDDNTILLKSGENKKRIPCETIENLHLFGEVSLNTKLLNFLSTKGILLHTYNYYGFYTGTFTPKETNISGKLLIKQVDHATSDEKRLFISKEIIDATTYNIIKVLKYYDSRDVFLDEEIKKIEILKNKISYCKSINQLMGYEGSIRKIYYSCFNKIIDKDDFKFEKRVKNPPDNYINSLISFLNSLVYTTCLSEIYKTHLNPTISFLHEPSTKRFSLCLDISEIFKPILADRLIFKMLNKKIIKKDDFVEDLNYLALDDMGKRKLIDGFNERLETTIHHKKLGKKVSYKHLIRLECYKIIKHLIGEEEYEGFKIWW